MKMVLVETNVSLPIWVWSVLLVDQLYLRILWKKISLVWLIFLLFETRIHVTSLGRTSFWNYFLNKSLFQTTQSYRSFLFGSKFQWGRLNDQFLTLGLTLILPLKRNSRQVIYKTYSFFCLDFEVYLFPVPKYSYPPDRTSCHESPQNARTKSGTLSSSCGFEENIRLFSNLPHPMFCLFQKSEAPASFTINASLFPSITSPSTNFA